MAISKLSAPFEQLSGAIGGENGVVAMPDRNGRTLLRENFIPFNPGSSFQQQIRADFTTVSGQYSLLNESQKDAWSQAASGLEETGRLGDPYGITGHMLFIRVNMYRLLDNAGITQTPPSTLGEPGPTAINASIASGDVLLDVQRDVPPSGGFYYIKASGTDLSVARNARQNELRAIAQNQEDSIIPVTTTGAFQSITISNPRFAIQDQDRRGLGIIQLNPDYFPVNGIFLPNVQYNEI